MNHDVLYNASLGGQLFRYDHLVHASGVAIGTLTLWMLAVPAGNGRDAIPVWVWMLGGLGLGALNETIEFLTTLANHGSHVGGYTNTGWDLVSNVVGAAGAGLCIARSRHPVPCAPSD